jgi:hypothetical protein
MKFIGPYQMMDHKQGCEIATQSVDIALTIMKNIEEEAIISIDAANAFNSISRKKIKQLINLEIPALSNYFDFLYGSDIIIDFDHNRRINMFTGLIQGLMSSTLFYAGGKWNIQNEIKSNILKQQPQFKINFQTDYVDDGVIMMNYKYVPSYLNQANKIYKKWDINTNKTKTEVIMNTQNIEIQNYIENNLLNYRKSFKGQIEYLGVPHGNDSILINSLMINI